MTSTVKTLTDFSSVAFVETLSSNINQKNENRQLAYQNNKRQLQNCLLQIQSRQFFEQINLHFEILHSITAQSQLWNVTERYSLMKWSSIPAVAHTAYVSSNWKAAKSKQEVLHGQRVKTTLITSDAYCR